MMGKGHLASNSKALDILLAKYEGSLDLVSPYSLSCMIKSCANFIGLIQSSDEIASLF